MSTFPQNLQNMSTAVPVTPLRPNSSPGVSDKPFVCHRCRRHFARSEHLQRHERSHTKEKPFCCSFCTKSFTRKDLLTRHNRLAHSEIQHGEAAKSSFSDRNHRKSIGCHTPAAFSASDMALPRGVHHFTGEGLQMAAQDLPKLHEIPNSMECVESLPDSLNASSCSGTLLPDDLTSLLDIMPGNIYSFQSLPLFDWHSLPPTPDNRRGITITDTGGGEQTGFSERQMSDLSSFGSRLPSLQPEDRQTGPEPAPKSPAFSTVTSDCRDYILEYLKEFPHIIPDSFVLPSRHALSRFVAGYFTGFHEHYPMIHIPSFHPETISVDLLLSMAALGAQYCREPEQGLKLFHTAKAVNLARIKLRSEHGFKPAGFPLTDHCVWGSMRGELSDTRARVEILQCLILFVAISTWFEKREIAQEAFSVLSMLDYLIRDDGLECPDSHTDPTWEQWVLTETMNRTKFLGFCFFNLYTILFSVPPLILSSEIDIFLPSTQQEWRAESAANWERVRTKQPRFQVAMRDLFDSRKVSSERHAHFSSLGGYVLIHGIIQNIWLLQRTSKLLPRLGPGRPSLSVEEVEALERALKQWSLEWERNQESSMDPAGPYGPVPFNSTALLRLAYVRINMEVGPVQPLRSWNADQIALTLHRCPPIQRSGRLTRAALHCAHALSIPVKLGINFVAHTQAIYWSNQHAICSLESASLLSKWLQIVAVPGIELTWEERRLLDFVLQMVAEAQDNVCPAQLLETPRRLSAIVVRLWAKLFRSDSVWQMVGLVGKVLEAYADLLETYDL